jgi:hypothetical protein
MATLFSLRFRGTALSSPSGATGLLGLPSGETRREASAPCPRLCRLAGFAGPVATSHATTLTPNTILDGNTAGDGQCTLREAVGATRSVGTPGDCGTASGNDTIELGAATYALTIGGAGENANQMGDLDLGTGAVTSVAISGGGPGATTIDAGGLGDRLFEFVGPSSFALSGLTLTGGHLPTGAPFPSNSGGAIRAAATGTLTIMKCVVTGNHAADGAGGTVPAGPGQNGGDGGGIQASTRLTVIDSVISANHAGNGGAGGAGADAERGNGGDGGEAGDGGAGGGIYANAVNGSLTITGTTISGNSAGSGGAGGTGGSGVGSIATGGNGGAGGFGGWGGGLRVAGPTLAIANSTLSGNSAGTGGTGGRGGEGGSSGAGGGGGIGENGGNAGGLSSSFNQIGLTNVTFANNSAGTGGHGGTGGPGGMTAGNGGNGGDGAPGGSGGAIHAITLENSNSLVHGTLSGNAAGAAGPGGSGGKGGGGATGTSGPPGAGGDIFNVPQTNGSPINVANTIAVGGSAPACSPPPSIANGGHNAFADPCLGPPGPNPLLGPLQDNGGPTQTMALQPGSPAIDLVPTLAAQCPATDQRGVSRPASGACDAGAYEVAPPSATTGPATGVDSSNATLTGTVRPNSGDAAVHFEYGPTTAYGSQTAVQHLSGSSDQPVNATLTGLSPSTTYHFRSSRRPRTARPRAPIRRSQPPHRARRGQPATVHRPWPPPPA